MMIATYLIYVALSLGITYWVGRTLHTNGRIFLIENFAGREDVADAINNLLLVGFYLVNVGFISLALRFGEKPVDATGALEFLSMKIGAAVVVLGLLHFFNMIMLVKFRNSRVFGAAAKAAVPKHDMPLVTAAAEPHSSAAWDAAKA
ncbi:hypothetical protein [Aestuariivirga sp.]|uniref:hypothetical protein n=1 Tax=Aestuariivirga sp. TaxID=2650926 RepID=UPI0039E47691